MTTSVRFHRFAAGSAAIALAVSAATLIPQASAQAPVPPQEITAGDAKEFQAAVELMDAGKWLEAMQAFEKFRDKYKMLSPRSVEAHFRLAISYLQQKPRPLTKEAVAVLRALLANTQKFNDPPSREQAQMLIAKAFTLEGAGMPSETDIQKTGQAKVFEEAIKEYGVFLSTYPQSRSGDTAHFLTGVLQLNVERYEDAIKSFGTVYQRYANSPLRLPALLNIGKTFMAQGYALMAAKKGKEATEAEVNQALSILKNNALPSLTEAYKQGQAGDLAIQNESIYYIGQIQLTRSQHASNPDEAVALKDQMDLLNSSLEAFRAVRSREEVVQAQEQKIEALRRAIQLLKPGTAEYLPTKTYYENLIDLEAEKKQKFLDEQDQFLGARLAISRIFLFLKKPDECRVLLRYLQGQKELLEKEKAAQASIAALLCLTYIEQKNVAKAQESYDAFRAAFKGNLEGDNLPLLLANLLLINNQPEAAEGIVGQGTADYTPWRFKTQATLIIIAAAVQKSNFAKALELADGLLAESLKPEDEVQVLYLKGTVQRAMASEKSDPKLADQAIATFQVVRDKFPAMPQAEDAWSEQCAILASRDPAKALPELQKYLAQFAAGGGKSENTKNNVPIAQFRLGQVQDALGKKDDALKSYQEVYTKWPDSEPAPGAFFKMFDIYKDRKDYANCSRLMEEFIQKYPEHENVYYAFNNMAEFLFAGSLNTKVDKDGKPVPAGATTIQDTEAGAKKLIEYVDYELSKNLAVKRGDSSLLKVADKWMERLSRLPSYVVQSAEQKQQWQRSIEGVITAVEKMLKSYPNGEKLGDALERLTAVHKEMLKAGVIDLAKGETYFTKLADEASSPEVKAKLMFALGAFVQASDPKKAAEMRAKGFALGASAPKAAEEGSAPVPVFTATDWDSYLGDLFEARKLDDITAGVTKIRSVYVEDKDPEATPQGTQNALAVALYWEAKVLAEQGKTIDAGTKFSDLAKKYPKSPKVLEADYGIISGLVEQNKYEDETFIPRLNKIVLNVRDVKTFELPAKALFLMGQIYEKQKDYEAAISTYMKIHTRYASVPEVSGNGLWAAAQLLERQASGGIQVRTQKELGDLQKAKAAKAKAAREKEEAEKKKAEGDQGKADPQAGDKTGDPKAPGPKATEAKPGDAKAPGVAKAEPAQK